MSRRSRRARSLPVLALLGLVCLAAAPSHAHDLLLTDVLLVIKADGTFQADMVCDLDALALGAGAGADSAELAAQLRVLDPAALASEIEQLRQTFARRVRVEFDGEPAELLVSFPHHGTPFADEAAVPTVLGLTARLEGKVPEGAAAVTFRASRAFPPVYLTVLEQATARGVHELLEQGVPSEAFALGLEPEPEESAGTVSGTLASLKVAGQYLVLGFWHIVPEGLDHILFVLGLFLLSARLGPLLWQVTAFTLAHAVTLALATYGVFTLPSSIVEPLIALSIAWVAIENVLTSELKPWRPLVVFAFGLLHGLGFAGVLGELGLPPGEMLPALVAFNVGIELGQLAVLLTAFLVIGQARDRPWYRPRVVVPLSLLIAAVGLYWAVTRAFLG